MKQLFLFLILMCSASVFAQTATITFTSQDTVTVRVAKPVDGNYNPYYHTPVKLSPGHDQTYSFELVDLGLVSLEYSTGEKFNLYVYPDAKITMSYNKGRISATGDSAPGSVYLNYGYLSDYRLYTQKMNEWFLSCIKKGNKLSEFLNCRDSIPHFDLQKVNKLHSDGQITSQVTHALKKKFEYEECIELVTYYNKILSTKELVLQKSDSVLIYAVIDSVYTNCPPDSCFTKYQSDKYYMIRYYEQYKYPQLSETEKKLLSKDYSDDTFGPFKPYLLAPKSQRLSSLYGAFMSQYAYCVNELNRRKLIDYFAKEYPDSESFSIISEVWKKHNETDVKPTLLTDTVNSLKELVKLKALKGKYIFVDLWATWCLPCKMQFVYKAELNELLNSYPNLTMLFISIDNHEKEWLNTIYTNLSGLHLRATEKLTEDIRDKLYKNERISIPRYILLDPEGNIVNGNLSRPSQIEYLKKELDSVFAN